MPVGGDKSIGWAIILIVLVVGGIGGAFLKSVFTKKDSAAK